MTQNEENLVIFTNTDGTVTVEALTPGVIDGMQIDVSGSGNRLKVSRDQKFVGCNLNIYGNRNTLDIGLSKNPIYHSLFHFAPLGHDRSITIGSDFSGGGHFRVVEDGTYISIGDRCLFSWDITVMASDYHAIYDETGKVINKAVGLTIGNDVWVGCKATILKDTAIPNGCIIGACSLITKSFKEERCLLAGSPASIIKRNVRWNYYEPHVAPSLQPLALGHDDKEAKFKHKSIGSLLQRFGLLQPKSNG